MNSISNSEQVRVFENSEFGNIKVLLFDGEPWFVGKDIAEILGYTNSRKAIANHVDKEDKNTVTKRDGNRGNPNITIINESGLYSLVLSSKLPTAKKFKRWVTVEVLPSIRKHGAYMTEETLEKALLSPDFLIQLAQKLKAEQEKNEKLSLTNAALVEQVNSWDDKTLILKLVRRYASARYHRNYQAAFNAFYRDINYKLHINLKSRHTRRGNSKLNYLDMLTEKEQKSALKVIVAMCEEAGIDTGKILQGHALAA